MSVHAQVAKTAAKVATETAKKGLGNGKMPGAESSFDNMMNKIGFEQNSAHPADKAVSAQNLNVDLSRAQDIGSTGSQNTVADAMAHFNRGNLQMDKLMEMVSSGENFTKRELLLMQAGLHKLTFETEIMTRAMDAAKSTVQTLVQRTAQ